MTTYYRSTVNDALPVLCRDIMTAGDEMASRLGDRVKEIRNVDIGLAYSWKRYVTVPGRRVSLPAQIAETMWVLAGRNDIGWLENYLPRAADFSDDGLTWRGGYGPRLRHWPTPDGGSIDQLAHVLGLLQEDSTTRRAVISLYNPAIDAAPGRDIPCNNWLQFANRDGQLHMAVATRSNDLIWGWSGINAFEWSALLEIMAGLLGLDVGTLRFHIASLHIYDRHWTKARQLGKEDDQITSAREMTQGAFVAPAGAGIVWLDGIIRQWFQLETQLRLHPDKTIDLDDFPEPMLRSWLGVIGWWWSGNEDYLKPIRGTDMERAARTSPVPTGRKHWTSLGQGTMRVEVRRYCDPVADEPSQEDPFRAYVAQLHATKDAAYGDSWKKRGEMMSILPNIFRKVDRLGKTDDTETAVDTAVDLLVYLIKYADWLDGGPGKPASPTCVPDALIQMRLLDNDKTSTTDGLEQTLREYAESLAQNAERSPDDYVTRRRRVKVMLNVAYRYARRLWLAEQEKREALARLPEDNATKMFQGYATLEEEQGLDL